MRHAHDARLRATLDTNVYVSAFNYRRGPSFKVWLAALEGRFHLVVSPAIVTELARVLRTGFKWKEQQIQEMLRTLVKVAEIVVPQKRLTHYPSDDRILECAVEGHADLIVSGDHHLKRLKVYQGIAVVTAAEFWRTLGSP